MKKLNAILNRTKVNSGCSIEEQHTAALIALKMAINMNNPMVIARARVAVYKTSQRRSRLA